jgi:putative YhdH/YhfP family quinone oxidoreductase
MTFKALLVNKTDDDFSAGPAQLEEADLMPGEVTIDVEWSSVNYKDGLAVTPNGRVVTRYPMIPGVDLAGTVTSSESDAFKPGDKVVAIGNDIGVAHYGGYAEKARIPAEWTVKLPGGLTTKEAMALGTAGFTAALSIDALERYGVTPQDGTVLVTGSTGGVGSTAVSMLAGLGYTVAGSTGKDSEHDYLRQLGATEILSREEVSAESNRPMESQRWAAAIDPVGGATTAYLLRTTKYGGAVAISGLAGGTTLNTTVFPFILRGVSLLGIDSVQCPRDVRERIWQRMATDLKPAGLLESIAVEATLDNVLDVCASILKGEVRGRTLVRLGGS